MTAAYLFKYSIGLERLHAAGAAEIAFQHAINAIEGATARLL